ncbi:MAG: FISUMP domain-containing protein [Bacteroidota bacterium]|nr:FISUMP domain-containing protein [Bacteroidota bacterium]
MRNRNLLFFAFSVFTLLGCEKDNPPEIIEITVSPMNASGGTTLTVTAHAIDEDQDLLSYLWTCESGMFIEGATSAQTTWKAPVSLSDEVYSMKVSVSDGVESVSMTTLIDIGKTETSSISGFVYFSGCTLPISGVAITVNEKSATTDSDGYFLIDGIPVGENSLVATKEDYDTVTKEITVSLENEDKQEIVLMTTERYSTIIYGTITGDHTGAPKTGLTVMILNPDSSDSDLKTTTSSSGSYQLPPVPQGERTFVVKVSDMVVFKADLFLVDAEYPFNIVLPEPFEFTDNRDGNRYNALKIGTQTWMTKNLAYLPSVSPSSIGSGSSPYYYVYAYEGSSVEDAIEIDYMYIDFGVLYNWEAAKTACPSGWHLPSDKEWKTLEQFCGMSPLEVDAKDRRISGSVGLKLKSTTGWYRTGYDNSDGNGNNRSGFNVFPGGHRDNDDGFRDQGHVAHFWSSDAWLRGLSGDDDGVYRSNGFYRNGYSVRCIQNQNLIK